MARDRLFNKKMKPSSFAFNQEVAEVFPDMLERSIPGYGTTIDSIRFLASKYSRKETNCYDLGCSLGASSIALGEGAEFGLVEDSTLCFVNYGLNDLLLEFTAIVFAAAE